MTKTRKCKCKLDIVVIKQAKDCPVHPDPIPDPRQEERENILSALGEHPDSPVDIPQRVADIRDEGRAHFHSLTQTLEQLEKAKVEYDPKHLRTCDCYGCRRFRRAFTPNPDRPIYLQLDDEKRKVRELSADVYRLKDRVKTFEENYVHQDLLLGCQDQLSKALGNKTGCRAGKDGDCTWNECPQVRDGEPASSGRHCPLDLPEEES